VSAVEGQRIRNQQVAGSSPAAGSRNKPAAPIPRTRSTLVFLGGRPLHADALGSVPTSYLPTGGLVDLLAARVYHPSARCVVRRGDDFPVAGPVRGRIADLKLHREDLGVGRWLALFLGSAGWHLSSTDYFSGRRGQNGLVGHSAPPEFGGSVHARYQEARTPVRVTRRARWEAVVSLRLKGPERTMEWPSLLSAGVPAQTGWDRTQSGQRT